MKKIITALDVGSTKITTIIAQIEDNTNIAKVIGVSSIPSAGLKKGVIVNIDSAVTAIANSVESAERMAGINVNSVILSINGTHIISTNNKGVITITNQYEISKEDVFRSIESARTVAIPPTREIIHVVPREFIVDMQNGIKDPIGMSGSRMEVDAHIVSGVTSSIQNLQKCVQSLGLSINDIVFTGWASAISTLSDTEKQLGVLLLDIGGGTTSICSFIDESINYSGSIDLGGMNLTSDLAVCLRITLEDAEKLKLSLNSLYQAHDARLRPQNTPVSNQAAAWQKLLGKKSELSTINQEDSDYIDISYLRIEGLQKISRKMVNTILGERIKEIFEIAKKQVEQSGFSTHMPAGIILTGGSSLIPNVSEYAKTVFGTPARIAVPKGLSGMVDEITSPAFATVQGLVMHAIVNNKFESADIKVGQTIQNQSIESGQKPNIFGGIKKLFGKLGT